MVGVPLVAQVVRCKPHVQGLVSLSQWPKARHQLVAICCISLPHLSSHFLELFSFPVYKANEKEKTMLKQYKIVFSI